MTVINQLIDAFSGEGAFFMYAITLVGAYTCTVIMERTWFLWFAWTCSFLDLHKAIIEKNWSKAKELSVQHPVALLFVHTESLPEDADPWDALSCAAPEIESLVQKRISLLSASGSIATMLGLLGTVYGLIMAMQGLDQASVVDRSMRLSEGISTAMITTAGGLLVGIPALAGAAILSAKAGSILAQIEATAALIARYKKQDS
jgi:biopolymer transport protein ExbB/TolQ